MKKTPALLAGDIRNTQKANFWLFMLISLTNIAKYRRQANHIDESKFGDTEGLLVFGDDCKIFRGSN